MTWLRFLPLLGTQIIHFIDKEVVAIPLHLDAH